MRLVGWFVPGPTGWRDATGEDSFPQRRASIITATVVFGFFVISLFYVIRQGLPVYEFLPVLGLLTLVLLLQVCHSFPRFFPWMVRCRTWTYVSQIALTYLPFLLFGGEWFGVPGFLAASSLLLLVPSLRWWAFAVVVASTGGIQLLLGSGLEGAAFSAAVTLIIGLVVSELSRMSNMAEKENMRTAGDEIRNSAIMEERIRFARDLHDALGCGLLAIKIKCELSRSLIRESPERAEGEVSEIIRMTGKAISEVRSVARNNMNMGLRKEIHEIESLLQELNIKTASEVAEVLPVGVVDTAMAVVLREGVANILRHGKTRFCRIMVANEDGHVRLTLMNYSVRVQGEHECRGMRPLAGGNGLGNLLARVEALGGSLKAGLRDDGWFELTAKVPYVAQGGRAEQRGVPLQPSGLLGDAHGVQTVACLDLDHGGGEVVPHGAGRQE